MQSHKIIILWMILSLQSLATARETAAVSSTATTRIMIDDSTTPMNATKQGSKVIILNSNVYDKLVKFHDIRQRLFLAVVEPIIINILGPVEENNTTNTTKTTISNTSRSAAVPIEKAKPNRRRLGFLPSYVEDVSVFRESSMSFATVSMLFTMMGCVMLVFLSCFYHNQKTSPLFISPRRHRLPKLVPPPLPVNRTLSWVKVCLVMSDEEIINRVGYDSLIFIRFHRLALRCIVKMSIFSFLVLLPLNFTGGGHANASDLKGYVGTLLFTDFLRFTMANVSGGSPRLWVHCFAAYLLTAIVCRELLVEYNAFNNIRHRYLLSREPHLRTVLVSNIPRHLRTTNKITTYFKNVYPDAVKNVTLCQNLIRLERLVAQRTCVLAQIERELLILCRFEKRKLVGPTRLQQVRMVFSLWNLREMLLCFDGSQERLSKLYTRLEVLNDLVQKEQKRRQRVMTKLDKMEAAKGSKDIDYLLASPFLSQHHRNQQLQGIGVHPASPRNEGTYRPPSFSEQAPPRQRKSCEETPEAEVPEAMDTTKIECDPQLNNSNQPIIYDTQTGELKQPPSSSGPILRLNAIQQQPDESFVTIDQNSDAADPPTPPDDTDANDKKLRRPFSKAKQAIHRYAHLSRKTSILGRPSKTSPANNSHPSEPKHKDGHIEDHTNEVTDKAFVVMSTFTASTIAIQSMHSAMPGSMEVSTAPEPRDVLWENIYLSKGAKRTRSYIGEAIVLIIITFYIVPVALVSLLVSESALISSSPRLAQLDQASVLFSSVIALVQPLCVVGLQQILPVLFIAIGKAEGLVSFSEVQLRAFSRYFMFQVVNIFLVTAVAGSIFDTIAIIVENPEAAFEMLGNALPRMSSFFITFVIMRTFLGLGIELVRTFSIVQACLRYVLFPMSTLREQRSVRIGMRAIDDPGWFPFHKIFAQDMLVVVISVVFAVVAPLVLIPATLFFQFSRIIWTHHHLYVYESVFETGGQFWPKIFRRFVFGLIIAQATITGQFILKEARHEAYATLVLMGLTYFFLRSTRRRYDQASSTLPLEVATVMDISVGQEEETLRQQQQRETRESALDEDVEKKVVRFNTNKSTSDPSMVYGPDEPYDPNLGRVIGKHDPFEYAYFQPALRADPSARPEQPFPPAQLGREEVFLGQFRQKKEAASSISTHLTENGGVMDTAATVRLKSLNREDRKLVDRWWNDQLQQTGKQHWLPVLIGAEAGTLLIGRRTKLVEK